MTSALRVSVIIPTYRRAAHLARCLDGLQRQSAMPDEILVALRDDDPQTRQLLDMRTDGEPNIRVVRVGRCGASAARNACIACASGDILAMVDDDTVARPLWLESMRDWFAADATVGGVGGPDWPAGTETPVALRPGRVGAVQWCGRRIGNHHRGSAHACDVAWLKGANMAVRKAALPAVPFGEMLCGRGAQFAEDVGLSLAVKRAGWRLVYDPAVEVDHYSAGIRQGGDHRSLRDDASLADAAYNDTVTMLRYLPPGRRVVFLCWSLLVGIRLMPGMVAGAALLAAGHRSAGHRVRIVAAARIRGWRAWRKGGAVSEAPRPTTVMPGAPLRICLVTHAVHRGDGQGRVNYELARYLADRGHAVTLVASEVDELLAVDPHVTWIRVGVPRRAPAPLRWLIFAWRVRRILGARPGDRFDIVHLHGAIAPVRASVNTSHFVHAKWREAIRWATEQSMLQQAYQRGVAQICTLCERRAYRTAGRVVAVSDAVRQSLRGDVADREVDVIYTGVDTAEFRPWQVGDARVLHGRNGVPADAFVILFVGDAKSQRKNLDLALRAISRLGPDVHLAIVGGAAGGPYPAMAARLGVRARVHFLGARTDVAACYRDANLVFCAAHYEPASLVLLEAMASGVPVLTAPNVGNAVFVDDGANGFLLRSVHDVFQAVAVVDWLKTNPALAGRVGASARRTALRLSWQRMGQQYEQLYHELQLSPLPDPRPLPGAAA